ncbi:MAG: hypothetical protein WDN04_02090 [Rhodospirillales bacterium]
MIDTNRAAYVEILGAHPGLDQILFDQGTTVFPRLTDGDGDRLSDLLTTRYDTGIVPGRFFGRPRSHTHRPGRRPIDDQGGPGTPRVRPELLK